MQQTIGKTEIRRIYALGAGAGLLNGDRDAHDDDLHAVVRKITGKESVSDLSRDEYAQVERYLLGTLSNANRSAPPERPARAQRAQHEEHPGGVTADQQHMIWYQLYQLRDKDGAVYSKATLGERLCGIIRKQFHRDCTPERPFVFLTLADGWRLIEVLKGMNENVKPKGGTRNAR